MMQEHIFRLYHKCLTDLLSSTGAYENHQHFESLTSDFNFQTELMTNIGYSIHANGEDEQTLSSMLNVILTRSITGLHWKGGNTVLSTLATELMS
eukprot:11736024-Ditylum_brightwellii.AAC.1